MEDKKRTPISIATLQRMPNYISYLKQVLGEGCEYISSVALAEVLQITPTVVKKDLSFATITEGKPKIGFYIPELIKDLEHFMGYDNVKNAVIVGIGHLGSVLLSYPGFANYGLNIIAGFDKNQDIVNTKINGKEIMSIDKLEEFVSTNGIKLGIITVPKQFAQGVATKLAKAGIEAIWNFAPTHIIVPNDVVIKNEDMAASLAWLSKQLVKNFIVKK